MRLIAGLQGKLELFQFKNVWEAHYWIGNERIFTLSSPTLLELLKQLTKKLLFFYGEAD